MIKRIQENYPYNKLLKINGKNRSGRYYNLLNVSIIIEIVI
jgi:hypothetical protein